MEDLEDVLPAGEAEMVARGMSQGDVLVATGQNKALKRLKRRGVPLPPAEGKENEDVGGSKEEEALAVSKMSLDGAEEGGEKEVEDEEPAEEKGASVKPGVSGGGDMVDLMADWEEGLADLEDEEEPEELVEFLRLERGVEDSKAASLSGSGEQAKSEGRGGEEAQSDVSSPSGEEAKDDGPEEDDDAEIAFDTEHDANAQRDMIADAERERIGKGFNPDIKPMSSILEKINLRVQQAAMAKPAAAEPTEEAEEGLKFSDFADKIMNIKPTDSTGDVINVEEPAKEEDEEEEGGKGTDEGPEASAGAEEDEAEDAEEMESEDADQGGEEKKRKTNEIRLAAKEPEPEPEPEPEEDELQSEEEEEEEEESETEESETEVEEEEEQANGFTWEEDEPLPDELEAELEGEKAKEKAAGGEGEGTALKKKLPKVNRGFVEDEAELSDDEGHLHEDENGEEMDDEDDDGKDLEDLIDNRKIRESDDRVRKRTKLHQNWINEKEDEDLEELVHAVETGFRKKRKGLAGEEDEGNDRDARRRRADLADLGGDDQDLERIFDAKMIEENDMSDGEVEMIEAAYKRRNQRLAEKKQREKEKEKASESVQNNLISHEALASIIPRDAAVEMPAAADVKAKRMFIPRDAAVGRVEEEEESAVVSKTSFLSSTLQYSKRTLVSSRKSFVFGQKKTEVAGEGKSVATEKTQMPKKVDSLLRSSSLVKLLNTKSKKNQGSALGTQTALDLSRIINM
ncbi:MRC1 domain-containing protein [Chloropicon primus]|nr:MRC1 domain-containing protein [Chloropicon primus]